LVAGLECCH
jgi:serine/threonine protein kinase